ncbi:MAG: peptidoglycan recognition protein [Actinomycetales bacterium]|nr:peptidoglycan recognition protein [Actinomycetales bacterium]
MAVACGVATAAGTGLAEADAASTAPAAGEAGSAGSPVPVVRSLALRDPTQPLVAATGWASDRSAAVAPRDTRPFSMLGVTWSDPEAAIMVGAVRVRARSLATGRWSGWLEVETGDEDLATAESGARGGTSPLWVGPSDGVEVQVDGGRSTLPAGLRLELVDPGRGEQPRATTSVASTATTKAASGTSATTTAASTVKAPTLVSRSGWKADESIRGAGNPSYGTAVKVVFLHHTAGTNSYACSESAAIVRGVYSYHVTGRGWRDIGYNFLVDKCGKIFEGRQGGTTRPVVGAHTLGFNRNSAGIAVLGTYSSKKVSTATRAAIAHLALWRLRAYGGSPTGKASLTASSSVGSKFVKGRSYTFTRLSAHRNAGYTECPGDALYGQLSGIRTLATKVSSLAVKSITGARLSGGVYTAGGAITVSWTVGTPTRLITRFQVLVDGKVVTTKGPSTRSAKITLRAGRHKVAVRATHLSGATATTAAKTVVRKVSVRKAT